MNDNRIRLLLFTRQSEKYSPLIIRLEHSGIQLEDDSLKTELLSTKPVNNTGNALMRTNPKVRCTLHGGHIGNVASRSNNLICQ